MVPLIPADLLPEWVEVEGYPRTLTPQETLGLTSVGSAGSSDQVLTVTLNKQSQTATPAVQKPNIFHRNGVNQGFRHDGGPPVLTPPLPGFGKFARRVSEGVVLDNSVVGDQVSVSSETMYTEKSTLATTEPDHLVRGDAEEVRPPMDEPANIPVDKKEDKRRPCAHWCKTGRCRFQKCRYKHEMPQTPAGLAGVGLTTLPRWWLAKTVRELPAGVAAAADLATSKGETDEILGIEEPRREKAKGGKGKKPVYPQTPSKWDKLGAKRLGASSSPETPLEHRPVLDTVEGDFAEVAVKDEPTGWNPHHDGCPSANEGAPGKEAPKSEQNDYDSAFLVEV